jgi:hypothetical protein
VVAQYQDVLGCRKTIYQYLNTHTHTGVHDFLVEPARGITRSPAEFGVGLVRGTQSLVKHSGYGVFNSVAKITGTLGKGAAELTFDREYLRERETLNREKAHHVGEGLAYGFRDLGLGIFQGIGGVVVWHATM